MALSKICTNKTFEYDAFFKGNELTIYLNYNKYENGLKWTYTVKRSKCLTPLFNGNAPTKDICLEIVESRLTEKYGVKTPTK